jgi:hypothetical protein
MSIIVFYVASDWVAKFLPTLFQQLVKNAVSFDILTIANH